MIDPKTGLLHNVEFIPSPNFNVRPEPLEISLLVIHNISLPAGVFGAGNVEKLFTNILDLDAHPTFASLKDLRVSAHLFIHRSGKITQFVPLHLRAWHAGISMFEGRAGCNDFSIGIELEGVDDIPFEPVQYVVLKELIKAIQEVYPLITDKRIIGHCDIAPDRKTDPGPAFDWKYLHALLRDSCLS